MILDKMVQFIEKMSKMPYCLSEHDTNKLIDEAREILDEAPIMHCARCGKIYMNDDPDYCADCEEIMTEEDWEDWNG